MTFVFARNLCLSSILPPKFGVIFRKYGFYLKFVRKIGMAVADFSRKYVKNTFVRIYIFHQKNVESRNFCHDPEKFAFWQKMITKMSKKSPILKFFLSQDLPLFLNTRISEPNIALYRKMIHGDFF